MTPLIDSTGTPVAMVALSENDLVVLALAAYAYAGRRPERAHQLDRLIVQFNKAIDSFDPPEPLSILTD